MTDRARLDQIPLGGQRPLVVRARTSYSAALGGAPMDVLPIDGRLGTIIDVPPVINVDVDDPSGSASFSADYGAPDPTAIVLTVSNSGGGGTFPSLTATIAYTTGEPTGWLAGVPTFTTGGVWQVPLQAAKGTMQPGFYHAAVTLHTPGAADVVENVTLQIQPVSASTSFQIGVFRLAGSVMTGIPVTVTTDHTALVTINGATSATSNAPMTATAKPTGAPVAVTFTATALNPVGGGTLTFSWVWTVWPHGAFGAP